MGLPFFDADHTRLVQTLDIWAASQHIDEQDDRAACREWVDRLGQAGWLRHCVPGTHGGARTHLDSRSLVLARETLAYHSPLADFAFAMQGLGSGAISLGGTPEQQAAHLPSVARGEHIAAFALTEPHAGSDVAALSTSAVRVPGGWRLDGTKTWISNGGMAHFYCLFAKTDPSAGARGITAFLLPAPTPGLDTSKHLHVMAPHPLAQLTLNGVILPDSARLGAVNGGFKLAMQTLDIFRPSVAGAALGMARRALAEATQHARQRRLFGQALADLAITQTKLGQMATLIDAAALLTYRAAWLRDTAMQHGGWADTAASAHYTAAAAMAKMTATENAQQVIDMALQLHGGRGVEIGCPVEALYRDIRALRIYEGATEVQQLIIGKAVLREAT
jgi:acyl-CoA dehydrogenase